MGPPTGLMRDLIKQLDLKSLIIWCTSAKKYYSPLKTESLARVFIHCDKSKSGGKFFVDGDLTILKRAITFYCLPSWGLDLSISKIIRYGERRTFMLVEIINWAADRFHFSISLIWGEYFQNNKITPVGIWQTNEDYQLEFNEAGEFHGLWGKPTEGFIMFKRGHIVDCSPEHDIDTLRDVLEISY